MNYVMLFLGKVGDYRERYFTFALTECLTKVEIHYYRTDLGLNRYARQRKVQKEVYTYIMSIYIMSMCLLLRERLTRLNYKSLWELLRLLSSFASGILMQLNC